MITTESCRTDLLDMQDEQIQAALLTVRQVLDPARDRAIELELRPEDYNPLQSVNVGSFVGDVLVAGACGDRNPSDHTVFEATKVATLPEYQGQGHGKAVMRALITEVRQRGGRMIWLDARTEIDSRTGICPLKMYERVGFRPTGEQFTSSYGVANLSMILELE